MIRPVTCLCLLAACASGLYLYSEKHRTELLDREIGHVIETTQAARARTNLLRAEWALLNEPGRLEDMAGRYLNLHPMAPAQFVQPAALRLRLPAPQEAVPHADADDGDDAPPPVAVAQGAVPTGAPGAPESVVVPPHAPVLGAAAIAQLPDAHPAAKLVARTDTHRAPRKTLLADRQDGAPRTELLGRSTPIPLAGPPPVSGRLFSAMARPAPTSQQRPAVVAAAPRPTPSLGSAPGSAPSSVLGAGTPLPPPVPYGR